MLRNQANNGPLLPEVLFGEILSRPLHRPFGWKSRRPAAGELDLSLGVNLQVLPLFFPLEDVAVALDDFFHFLQLQSVSADANGVRLRVGALPGPKTGRFRVSVRRSGVFLSADSPDGVRRGLVWMEEEMQGRRGPFLPLGAKHGEEVIKTRISRCFYAPIHRPPYYRNELADKTDYYPDEYLNRLAHDGVTALWITVKFRESVPSQIFPEYGRHASRDLGKLRGVVEKCRRYGIKVYVFCIEPLALPVDSPLFQKYPELRGARFSDVVAFCTQSEIGAAYVEEAVAHLFSAVPGLGGLIVIPVGEHFTHCASVFPHVLARCPRCVRVGRDKVLSDVLAGFRRGIDRVAPEAELIAWPYSQMICWGERGVVESASQIPPGVILQHNYESGGVAMQLGKPRPLWDYWLSWAGVSPVFAEAARRTVRRGGRMSAKLQVGNSHENANVPFIPVPGLLYRKYRALHRLGVSGVMQSWYFGNYPSLMTRAAGLLSYAPLPRSEMEFLRQLARKEWGSAADRVARAWHCFGEAYEHFPATHVFSYYGPVQDGVVWPLYLMPRREALAPTWQSDYPVSGDYLPHCFSHLFTLRELIVLCSRIVRGWQRGCRHLDRAYLASERTPAQDHEWRIAHAIRLQFETAVAILRFYDLREKLADESECGRRLKILGDMEKIVRSEITRRREFVPLLQREPALGYHSEAEGFKITADRVENAVGQLQALLKTEFVELRKQARCAGLEWFGAYTGRACGEASQMALRQSAQEPVAADWAAADRHMLGYWLFAGLRRAVTRDQSKKGDKTRMLPVSAEFQMLEGRTSFYLAVDLRQGAALGDWEPSLVVEIEPSRMQPRVKFSLAADGRCRGYYEEGYFAPHPVCLGHWKIHKNHHRAVLEIPFATLSLARGRKPFRMAVSLYFTHRANGETRELAWVRREPLKARLIWDDRNPATDYGWVMRGVRKKRKFSTDRS